MPSKPPVGRPIQKGERRNPKGSSAKARNLSALRKAHKTMTPEEFAQLVSLFLNGTPQELLRARDDKNSSVLIKLVAKFLTASHDKADIGILKTLLEFTIGRPRERKAHEISGPDGGPIPTSARSEAEILAEIEQLRRGREAAQKSKK